MIIVPKNNLYLPRRLWPSRKTQRGSIGMILTGGVTGGPSVTYSLSGLGPYDDTDTFTGTYGVNVIFRTDGTVDVERDVAANLNNEVDPYTSDVAECWVRCTNVSGDDMTGGNTRGAWHRCNTQRNFLMRYTTSGGGPDDISGNFDFELSSDASGTPIEAQSLNRQIHVGDIFA